MDESAPLPSSSGVSPALATNAAAETASSGAAPPQGPASIPTSEAPHFPAGSSSHPRSSRSQVHIDVSKLPPGLSKSAAKKLAKKQLFEDTKLERRKVERDKKKQKKRAQYQQRLQEAEDGVQSGETTGKRKRDAEQAKPPRRPFRARLVIDLGFDELMGEREVASMGQQFMYIYSSNKSSHRPFEEVLVTGRGHVPGSSYLSQDTSNGDKGGSVRTQHQQEHAADPPSIYDSPTGSWLEKKMQGAWRKWKGVAIHERGGLEDLIAESSSAANPPSSLHLNLNDVVYLTADTDDTLTCLEEGKTYVLGGIVDRNRHKGLCSNKAAQLGIRRARLPITEENLEEFERRLRAQGQTSQPSGGHAAPAVEGEGAKKGGYQGRKVLTVNQVADILLGWTETQDWVEAIGRGIPRRRFEGGDPLAAAGPRVGGSAEPAPSTIEETEEAVRNAVNTSAERTAEDAA